jgi:hypothetical protein
VAAAGLGLAPGAAGAGAIIEAGSATTAAGQTGSFDVLLTSTSGSFNVSAFSVELSVPAGSGITFTGSSANTTAGGYLFTTLQSPPLTFATLPATDFIAGDALLSSPFVATLATGQTFGLEHVTFAVAGGAPSGVVPVSVANLGTNTELLDINAALISASASNGSINVVGAAVPEPSSLILGLVAAATLIGAGRIWRSVGRTSTIRAGEGVSRGTRTVV